MPTPGQTAGADIYECVHAVRWSKKAGIRNPGVFYIVHEYHGHVKLFLTILFLLCVPNAYFFMFVKRESLPIFFLGHTVRQSEADGEAEGESNSE